MKTRMKEKRDWKYGIACIIGTAIIVGSYFIHDYTPVSSICFIIVGVMIPIGYALFNRRYERMNDETIEWNWKHYVKVWIISIALNPCFWFLFGFLIWKTL